MQILVIDDSPSVRYALGKNLTEAGFSVHLAVDGQDGLNKALDAEYDLVITDIDMPKMNGFELCAKLKKERKTAHIPIIILSTCDSDEHIEQGFRVGVDAYLAKGEDIHENVERIKSLLRTKSFLTGSKILVVDDSSSVRLFLQTGLSNEGFIVETACNGYEALERLKSFKPKVIISDLMMPEMDGAELCQRLKQTEEHKETPIIIMSTITDMPVMRRVIREGATSYLIKPFNINQLLVIIEDIFSSNFRFLLEEKQRMRLEYELSLATIDSLVQSLAMKNSEQYKRSERMTRIACGIAEELNFTSNELEKIALIARLFDLKNLNKGSLERAHASNDSPQENKATTFEMTESLHPISELRDVLDTLSGYSEQWDGQGTPHGLKGEDIPLMTRILTVAATYEALTSLATSQESRQQQNIVAHLLEKREKQLCPMCTDALLKWLDQITEE